MAKKTVCSFFLFLLITGVATAWSYSLNARTMGMGGADIFASKHAIRNPAYRSVPPTGERQPLVIPIPIGLFKFLGDMPEFDPDEPDFDGVEIANLFFNLPLELELIEPPSTEQSDVLVDIGINDLKIDLGTAGDVIPKDEFTFGRTLNADICSFGFSKMFLSFSPILFGTSRTKLSDNLVRALRDAEPFVSDETYNLATEGEIGVGISTGLGYALRVHNFADQPEDSRDGIYFGFTGKYLIGLAYLDYDSDVDFITGNPIFSENNPMTTRMDGVLRTSAPGVEESGSTGMGIGLDLGLAVVRGPWEFGFGARDIASTIKCKVHEQIYRYDDETNNFEVIQEAMKKSYSYSLPRTAVFNLIYCGENYRLGADVRKEARGFSTHLGLEYDLMPAIKMRGGMMTDTNNMLQATGGMGFRAGWFGFDFALATNNDNLSREKGLSLYTSLAIY
jgi:hypothetical protein